MMDWPWLLIPLAIMYIGCLPFVLGSMEPGSTFETVSIWEPEGTNMTASEFMAMLAEDDADRAT